MLELDELKALMVDHNRLLEQNVRVNRQALNAVTMLRTGAALRRTATWLVLEALITLPVVILLGSFAWNHRTEARFLLPASMLMAFAIVGIGASVRHAALALHIDHTLPVAQVQKRIEALRRMRIRSVKWTFILATLMWTPMFIVGCRGLLHFDAYKAFGLPYIAGNLLTGLAIIPLGMWISRLLSERVDSSPLLQSLMRDLAGRGMSEAADFAATLQAFQDEPAG